MWDTKRQVIWLAAGLALGSFVLYQDSFDEDGRFSLRFFLFLETLLVLIMSVMFYLYSKKG